MIEWSPKILQAFVALILLWVWLFRFGRPTSFRGGRAKDLKEEFSAYGLPEWSFWAVGSCKVLLSLSLLAGLYFEQLAKPTALALTVFMFAAVWMHLKMKRDSLIKVLPAYIMLSACVFLVFD
jgi:uncharacterized membrane protein YphA (DoxX/SURF4 family)